MIYSDGPVGTSTGTGGWAGEPRLQPRHLSNLAGDLSGTVVMAFGRGSAFKRSYTRPGGFLQSFQDSGSGIPATSGRSEAQVALIALVGCWCRVAAPSPRERPRHPEVLRAGVVQAGRTATAKGHGGCCARVGRERAGPPSFCGETVLGFGPGAMEGHADKGFR